MQNLILIGGGGHCKVVIDAIRKAGLYNIYGIADTDPSRKEVLGIPVIGDDDSLLKIYNSGVKNAVIAIGSVGDPSLRMKLYEKIKKIGFNLPTIIHTSSIIAEDVKIEEGTFIAAGTVINTGTKIGKNVIINTSSSIDHDCQLGDFVHIAPGVTLSGGVKVGEGTHIGTGANIIQYLNIGKGCIIKAGALVRNNLQDGYTEAIGGRYTSSTKDEK